MKKYVNVFEIYDKYNWKTYWQRLIKKNWRIFLEKELDTLKLSQSEKISIINSLEVRIQELSIEKITLETRIENEYYAFSIKDRELFTKLASAYQKYKIVKENDDNYLKFKYDYDNLYFEIFAKLKDNLAGKNILDTINSVFKDFETLYSVLERKAENELIKVSAETQLAEIKKMIMEVNLGINHISKLKDKSEIINNFKKITYNIQSMIGVENTTLNDFKPMITDSSLLEKLKELDNDNNQGVVIESLNVLEISN
ncbi:MAG: hypothetical protein AM1032_000017 [Mycoplasmataceae bacterium]|nr:MAG: hypothetical protein AM1032_000017 [Mycoplasmataceae bacterium]